MKKTKKRNKLGGWIFTFFFIGLVGLGVSAVLFLNDKTKVSTASIEIRFNYNGVVDYRMPDGNRFTIDYLCSDEILEKALESTKLEARFTVEDVRRNLVVKGFYPEDLLQSAQDFDSLLDSENTTVYNSADYVATRYSVELYNRFSTPMTKEEMQGLLQAVAYYGEDYFRTHYLYVFNFEEVWSVTEFDQLEYSQQVDLLKTHNELIQSYASQMDQKDNTFSYQGKRFSDVVGRCEDLEKQQLSRMENYINVKGFAKYPARKNALYNYQIKLLNNEILYMTDAVADLDRLVESYERDSTKYIGYGDNVVVIDSNSTQTYQELVENRLKMLEQMTEDRRRITQYTAAIEDIMAQNSVAERRQLTAEIQSAEAVLEDIVEEFRQILQSYVDTEFGPQAMQCQNAKYNSNSLKSMAFIVKAVKVCGPFEMLLVLIFCAHRWANASIRYKRKQYRKA